MLHAGLNAPTMKFWNQKLYSTLKYINSEDQSTNRSEKDININYNKSAVTQSPKLYHGQKLTFTQSKSLIRIACNKFNSLFKLQSQLIRTISRDLNKGYRQYFNSSNATNRVPKIDPSTEKKREKNPKRSFHYTSNVMK